MSNSNGEDRVSPHFFIMIAGVVSIISSLGAPLVPVIANQYHISSSLGQWSLTIALLFSTATTPILAKLSASGRYKTIIFTVLILTALGCFISSVAPNFSLFLVGRALQGCGLGLIPTLMFAAQNLLKHPQKTVSLLSVTTGIGVGIGYPVSGVLVIFLGLKATFFFGGVFTLLAAVIATRLINREKIKTKFDFYGAFYMTIILCSLILLLGSLTSEINIKLMLLYALILALSLFFWVKSEQNAIDPLIRIRIVLLPGAWIPNFIALLSGTLMYMLISASMIRIQQQTFPGFAKSALVAGLVLTPLSIATLISRYISFDTFGHYARLFAGNVCLGSSFIVFSIVYGGIIWDFIAMALCGYGIGLIYGVLPAVIKEKINACDTAEVYSLNQISRSIGYSIGSVISINIISAFFQNAYGEPGSYAYLTLGTVAIIISIMLCLTILYNYRVAVIPQQD
ncbi:MFS transporter [Facilibium subflavum]|uniref:MFS transporter n=1 Tax=Facilibium subflavum TaxID=2219058 RepID=UPI000E64881C|nr:MFS transporter [Facilibium subflavum]